MSELTNPANSFMPPSKPSQKNSSRLKSLFDKQADGNQFIIEQLEQRLMFSADLAPVVFDVGLPDKNIMDESPVVETGLVPGAVESSDAVGTGQQRHEIIFIDAGVQDYEQLVDDLSAGTGDGVRVEVFILDNSRDGIEQISEVLANYNDIDAVHLVSHGADGLVQLGNARLNPETLDSYADDIEGWQDALTDKADILFYGCDLAAGEDGRALIESLTFLTGADVAASVDLTGNTSKGGDWDMEYTTGTIEAGVAFSIDVQQNWSNVLATETVEDRFSGATAADAENTTGNDGTQNWSNAWQKHSGGVAQLMVDTAATDEETNSMRFSRNDDGNSSYWRQADLTGATSATLSFNYRREGLEAGDDFVIYALNTEGSIWVQIGTILGGTNESSYLSWSTDISAYIDNDTAIRFDSADFASNSIDRIFIDNVKIEYNTNTPPTAANNTVTTNEDTTYVFTAADFNFLDDDGDSLTQIQITSLESAGSLQLSGVDVDLNDVITVANITDGNLTFAPAADANGAAYANFDFKVYDGTEYSASSYIMTIDVTPVGDTPQVVNITTFEDTQSGLIYIDRNADDGTEVTHFRISGITNGTLYQNDGATQINDGEYITVAQGQAGLKFTPSADTNANGSFNVQSSEDGTSVAAQSGTATSTITVTPVGDTPQVANITTFEDTQSGGIAVTRNSNDGTEVTYFRISGITNGTLYQNDGATQINDGDYITVAQGQAGLKFTPSANSNANGSFGVESSENGTSVAAQSGTATSTITVTPVNDAPTGTVTIIGTPTEGQTLTADNTLADADGLGAFNYQWKRDGTDISGATGSTYTLVNADAGATITVTISYTDGGGTVESITSTATAAVASVNDAPTATNLSTTESYTEDTALNLTDIVVSDVDSTNVTVTLTLSDVAAGSLSTGTSGSVISTFVSGVWTASGAIADVNTLLAGVVFTPASNYNSNFTIATSVSDGTASPITGTKNISGTPVGDTPQVENIITMVNTQSGLIVIDRNASDGAEVTHFRISNITNGTLYHADGTTQINNGDYITYAQARAGLKFTPPANSFATGSFDVESSEDGVSVAAQSNTSTSIITIALPIDEDTGRPLSEGNETSPDDSAKTADKEDIISEINNSDIKTNAQAYTITKVSGATRHSSGDAGRPESVINTTLRSLMEPFSMNRPVRENAALTLFKEEGVEDAANIEEDIYSSIEMALKSIESIGRQEKIITKAIVGGTLVLSVGLATWVLRGGSILASALTTMPLWKGFDPLPVLPLSRKERHKKIREVRTIEDEENMENKEVTELFDAGKAEQTKNDRKDDES